MIVTTQQHKQETAPYVLEDLAALKAISEPTRLRMLMLLSDGPPLTVKELSSELALAPTRLYYHIQILERAGMIRVASRRLVSGIEEKSYQATASNWVPSASVTSMLGKSGFLAALFNLVRAEVDLALRLRPGTEIGDVQGPLPVANLTPLALTTDQVEEVQNMILFDLQDRFAPDREDAEGTPRYVALCMLYRHPSELTESKDKNGGTA